jgi:predicted nucleic acid-binding Zn ribbon protein
MRKTPTDGSFLYNAAVKNCINIECSKRWNMKVMYALVIILIIISIVATLFIAGKGDDKYSSSTKRNFKNLTLIYGVIGILGLIVLGVYIWFFS